MINNCSCICNNDFFSCDSPESFYWADFIAADGCVRYKTENSKTLSILLPNKDHNNLAKMSKFKGTVLGGNMQNKKVKKRRPSDCKNCSGKYKLKHENNIPIFMCDKCGDLDLTWKKFYEEYLHLYRNKENWNNSRHHVSCVLGFFMHMYEEYYNTKYIMVPKNPNVFGSKEIKDIWELLSVFNNNANNVRRYIYWLFKHGINKNTTITNFGYINTPGLIRKYNIYAKRKNKFRRESGLPKAFIEWCMNNEDTLLKKYSLETMNDLGALLSYYNAYKNNDDLCSERNAIAIATKFGLIKNNKLNIG